MKTVKYLLIVLFATVLISCDKVDGPFREEIVTPIDTGGVTDTTAPEIKVRKVLLEDYTGAKCGNCPGAAVEASRLKELYGEKLVVLTVHTGFFAKPGTSPFTYDFRTTAGNDFDAKFLIDKNYGFPSGLINRRGFPSLVHALSYAVWGDSLINIINKEPDAYIKISNSYNSSSSMLTTTIKSEFLKEPSGDYSLGVYIAEDSIVKPQKFYNPDRNVLDHVHQHVLRGAVNTSWGEVLTSGMATEGATYTKTYTYTLNADWNASKCSVVAFIYNSATYEVIQVQETKIIK